MQIHRNRAMRRASSAGAIALAVALTALVLTTPASARSRPAAPRSLQVVTNGPGISLTWQSGAKRFVVQQAKNRRFTRGVRKYKVRQPGNVFTPYAMRPGHTYFFRVRALNSSGQSAPSNVAKLDSAPHVSRIRVLAYNSLAANQEGKSRPGGTVAPWSDRRGPQLDLIKQIGANVVGIEEGANCLRKIKGAPCYRQIDSLMDGLSGYTLVDTYSTSAGVYRYAGNYIAYDDTVSPVGAGGTWLIGPAGDDEYAAYQRFRVVATGATFLYVDTHLLADAGSANDKIRRDQTRSMVSQARAYAQRYRVDSVLYVGDFNAYVHQYQGTDYPGRVMRAQGFPEAAFVAKKRPMVKYDSNNELYRHARHGHGSIDRVFVTPGVGVKLRGELLQLDSKHNFIGTIPSDHNPVYADVTIPYS